MANICIVEDEADIRNDLSYFLKTQGHKVYSYSMYADFRLGHNLEMKGLYIIDWDLGEGENGLTIVNKIRQTNKTAIIFMLTANHEIKNVVEALKSGADDYIRKPFSFEELILKIDNSLHRHQSHNKMNSIHLIPSAHTFQEANKTFVLTGREYRIFEKLYLSKKEPTSRQDLANFLNSNSSDEINIRNIDVHIHSLRKKIQDSSLSIESIRSVGYVLRDRICNN